MGLISRVSSRTYRKSMNYVQFLKTVGQLKNTARTGWKIRNVPNFESVADHSWRMSLMALTVENLPKNVDRELAVKMCVVHDLAECIVGNIAPADNIPKSEKHRLESEAMEKITSKLFDPQKSDLLSLYTEYESQTSETAKFVKDLDRLEMCSQAKEYQAIHNINLTEFLDSCRNKFYFNETEKIFNEL